MRTRQTLLIGGTLAAFAALLVDHGSHFGASVAPTALLGVAIGAALGLIRNTSTAARAGSFIAGFVIAWIGFALRAGFLPDIPAGRAIATAVVVLLITALSAFSGDRVPMVASLLGASALTGAYEFTYAANPAAFTTDSVAAASTAMLCASLGFFITELISVLGSRPATRTEVEGDGSEAAAQPPTNAAVPSQRDAHHDTPSTSTTAKGSQT